MKPGDEDARVKVVSAGHVANPGTPSVQRPAPHLGEHTQEILNELGFSADDVERLRSEGCL